MNEVCEIIQAKITELEKEVKHNKDKYMPIADKAKEMMVAYPVTVDLLFKKINNLDKEEAIVSGKLDAIHERMDKHDKQEEVKRKERLDDRREQRKFSLTIILFLIGLGISFATWLSDIHNQLDNTTLRLDTHIKGESYVGNHH